MMRTTRLLALTLAFALLITLAACASGGTTATTAVTTAATTTAVATTATTKESASATTAASATTVPPLEEPIVIRYATFENYYANASYADGVPVVEKMEEIMNVKIEWELTSSSQYVTTMETRLAANADLPDIMNLMSIDVEKYGAAGVLADITQYISAEYVPYSMGWFSDHPEFLGAITSSDGKVYQLAGYRGRGEVEGDPYGFFIREDWLTALNLPQPTNLTDMYDTLTAFKEKDPNGNGQPDEIPYAGNNYNLFANSFGLTLYTDGSWMNDDGTILYTYTQDAYRDYLNYVHKLYAEGLMDPEFATIGADQLNAKVAQGVYGMLTSWFASSASYNKSLKSNNIDGQYVPILPLDQTNGDKGFLLALTILCRPSAFSASSDVLIDALRFFDWSVMSDEANILTNFGIEGLSYSIDSNNVYHYTDYALANPDGLTPMEALRALGCWPTFAYSFIKDSRYAMNERYPIAYEMTPKMREYVKDSLVFAPASSDQSSIYNMYMTDIDTYSSEMRLKFIDGSASLETDWDAYVADIEGIGIAEVVNVMQARYDTANK